jgi:pyrophosphate--fructose-6-phosphate 1-phosphotransferase
LESLLKQRLGHKIGLPRIFHNFRQVGFQAGPDLLKVPNSEEIRTLFPKTHAQKVMLGHNSTMRKLLPLKVGVLFSGGPAAGGHNVVIGLYDGLKLLNEESSLIGFIDGPSGLLDNDYIPLPTEMLDNFRNLGGFDLLGSSRTKIESPEQLAAAKKTVEGLDLDSLIVIGGDDSNTNVAILAEYFLQQNCKTRVLGVPKTIDGDLQNPYLQISFGFDTACKTYSEMIGNIARDAMSSKKYTHVIKVMGRSASHIALECAFRTHPNLTLISEEVAAKKMTLADVVKQIADTVEARAKEDRNYNIILVPEGLIEFVNDLKIEALPEKIRDLLLGQKDPHGNVQVSLIETDQLLIELASKELAARGVKTSFQGHFFGYEGRCGYPTNFDCNFCATLGMAAALLVDEALTGYMATVQNLHKHHTEWTIAAIPITQLLHMEQRAGKTRPVIKKALVDLNGKPFQMFHEMRKKWSHHDDYHFPGPIQFFGDYALTDSIPMTMSLAYC